MRTSFGDTPVAVIVIVAAAVGALGLDPHADSMMRATQARNRNGMSFRARRRGWAIVDIRLRLILPSMRIGDVNNDDAPVFCDTDG